MQIYLAGPLFSHAERAFLDACATRLRQAGWDCFVPHEQSIALDTPTPETIFALDGAGLRAADVLVAWLDGAGIDDGTACEIGLFRGLMEREPRRRALFGLITDLRAQRARATSPHGRLNLFVVGALGGAGNLCWSVDELLVRLAAWRA